MRPGRGVRVGIFAAVLAWHALVVILLLRQRIAKTGHTDEFVTTWLQLEPEREPQAVVPEPKASSRESSDTVARQQHATPPPTPDAPPPDDSPGTAITAPSRIDWYGEASRAARDQFANRLPVPRSLDDEPAAMPVPAPRQRAHQLGDQESLGHGEWKVWLGSGCYTIIRAPEPRRPGEFRPMAVTCSSTYPIDASVLEGRRPDYLQRPPIPLPRPGKLPGRTRPGPSMGGTPGGP